MINLIQQFNKFASENKSIIRKALDSSAGVAEALIPEHLEEVITNTIVRLSPELAMIAAEFDNQKYHDFNRLTALPAAGGAMGEGATTPTRNSTYARAQTQLKIVRRKGAVTNFLKDTSGKYIDAAAAEMENHLLAHVYDLATYILFGNAAADTYTFSGLDTFITTNRTAEAAGGAVPTSLGFMDDMIDENLDRQGSFHDKAIVMSPKMLSKVSQLLTNVRLNQGLQGQMSQVDIPGGWRLNAYRDIPIIVSSACRPNSTMGTITTATAAAVLGATIPDSTQYFFRVAAVTQSRGEQLASAEVNQTTGAAGGNDNTITLSWTAVTGALYYKIYCGTSTGTANTTLVRVISAFQYDGTGTITGNTTSLVFTSAPNTAGAEVPTELQTDIPLVATGGVPPEYVFFWDLDKFQGIGKMPYTNTGGSRFNGLVTIDPLAITDDFVPFLIKSYCALIDSYEATCSVHRGLRVS